MDSTSSLEWFETSNPGVQPRTVQALQRHRLSDALCHRPRTWGARRGIGTKYHYIESQVISTTDHRERSQIHSILFAWYASKIYIFKILRSTSWDKNPTAALPTTSKSPKTRIHFWRSQKPAATHRLLSQVRYKAGPSDSELRRFLRTLGSGQRKVRCAGGGPREFFGGWLFCWFVSQLVSYSLFVDCGLVDGWNLIDWFLLLIDFGLVDDCCSSCLSERYFVMVGIWKNPRWSEGGVGAAVWRSLQRASSELVQGAFPWGWMDPILNPCFFVEDVCALWRRMTEVCCQGCWVYLKAYHGESILHSLHVKQPGDHTIGHYGFSLHWNFPMYLYKPFFCCNPTPFPQWFFQKAPQADAKHPWLVILYVSRTKAVKRLLTPLRAAASDLGDDKPQGERLEALAVPWLKGLSVEKWKRSFTFYIVLWFSVWHVLW